MVLYLVIFILVTVLGTFAALYFMKRSANLFDRALQIARNGDYTDARGLIRSKIEANPDDFQAQYTMAEIYRMEKNEYAELKHLLEMKRINAFTPTIPAFRVLNRIGELYYKAENYTESFENFYESLQMYEKNESALVHLAFMAIGKGEFELAEKFFKPLIDLVPGVADYHLARGVGLSMLKNRSALGAFERAHQLKPDDLTTRFMLCFQYYKQSEWEKARDMIANLKEELKDPSLVYMIHKMECAVQYALQDFSTAQRVAEKTLDIATRENWTKEIYDARLSLSYMAILNGNLPLANEHLLELEIDNPNDQLVIKVSDFRMDVEEGVCRIDQVSPKGFDFNMYLQDWLKRRFNEQIIYQISGLRMEEEFDINIMSSGSGGIQKQDRARINIDYERLIDQFNSLKDVQFQQACEKIIELQGYRNPKSLKSPDRDGQDFVASSLQDKKIKALFRIRKWKNQPISDIFLRDMQNYMNELSVNQGYVIAGARLTTGAESALQNLKKIEVINEENLGIILQRIFS